MSEFLKDNRIFSDGTGDKFYRPITVASTRPSSGAVEICIETGFLPGQADRTLISRLTPLIHDLTDPDESNRAQAEEALATLGETAVPALIACYKLTPRPGLSQLPEEVGDEYTNAILAIGSVAVPHLIFSLTDPSFIVKLRSANALGRIEVRPDQKGHVTSALVMILKQSDIPPRSHTQESDLLEEASRALIHIESANQ